MIPPMPFRARIHQGRWWLLVPTRKHLRLEQEIHVGVFQLMKMHRLRYVILG